MMLSGTAAPITNCPPITPAPRRRLLTWNEDCKYSGDRITVSEFPDVEGCRFEEDGSTDYKLNEYCGSRSLTEYSQICIEICSLNSECEYWEAKDDGYCWMYPSSNSGETFEDSATNCGVTASSPPSPRPPPQSPPPQRPPPPTLPPPIPVTGAGSSPDCSECLREFTLHGYFFTTSAKSTAATSTSATSTSAKFTSAKSTSTLPTSTLPKSAKSTSTLPTSTMSASANSTSAKSRNCHSHQLSYYRTYNIPNNHLADRLPSSSPCAAPISALSDGFEAPRAQAACSKLMDLGMLSPWPMGH
ncbi:hypothetical protein CYMTET_26446 [Cymbomonas tetramitiformis]|uniref:Uncharacterized protein n=1 Tax=Cymbomonas tetramitiformis TaxID=36881 RepID=A0AAE0FSA5_9CHLO|nr:hypothetical protein CYMTET_26446 [Cymbomonas tetramitiformis]